MTAPFDHEELITNYRETYGDVTLSIAVGSGAYCTPRVGRRPIESYDAIELALLTTGKPEWHKPSSVLPAELVALWEMDDDSAVAGYVSREDYQRIREHLAKRAGVEVQPPQKWGRK